MKVKELIELLQDVDPEKEACFFDGHFGAARLIDDVFTFKGAYEDPDNVKLVFRSIEGEFVAINSPGDYDFGHRYQLTGY